MKKSETKIKFAVFQLFQNFCHFLKKNRPFLLEKNAITLQPDLKFGQTHTLLDSTSSLLPG